MSGRTELREDAAVVNETASVAGTGIRVCFCDLKGRPSDDWDAHDGFCLMLDWAMVNGKITPDYFLKRLGDVQIDLGITDEELAAEARTMPAAAEDPTGWQGQAGPGGG